MKSKERKLYKCKSCGKITSTTSEEVLKSELCKRCKEPEKAFKTIMKLRIEEIEKINKICQDIKDKDPSFDFEIKDNVLILFSKTEKEAFSRGCWFREKALSRELYFKIER